MHIMLLIHTHSRHLQPFKSRSLFPLIFSATSGYILLSWITYSATFLAYTPITCHITRWVINVTYPGMLLPYLVRALRLHLVFKVRTGVCVSTWAEACSREGMHGGMDVVLHVIE